MASGNKGCGTGKKAKFPKKECLAWLKGRQAWNHDDWLALLKDLTDKGFGCYAETPEGRDTVGAFLEANREK